MGEFESSSGSEHETDSVCLQHMVHAFMLPHPSSSHFVGGPSFLLDGSMGGAPHEDCVAVGAWQEHTRILKGLLRDDNWEEAELGVLGHVSSFIETTHQQQQQEEGRSTLQRSLMTHLRSRGYNAAICKSHPTHHNKLPPGKYEYMDVIMNNSNLRLVVEIDFRGQFEIARPTKEYVSLLELLPPVYVGKSDRLVQIVKIMTECVKMSLGARRMQVPPWRTYTYMLSKWLGSYKRTTNSSSSSSTDDEKGVREAWKPCHGRKEKKLMSRLTSLLMEGSMRSTSSGKEARGIRGDELLQQLAVA